jgi:hypothetical protein
MRLAQCCRRCTYIFCRHFIFSRFPVGGGSVAFVVAFDEGFREACHKLIDDFLLIIILGSLELIDAPV